MGNRVKGSAYINASYIISSQGFGVSENHENIYRQQNKNELWNTDIPICTIDKGRLADKVAQYGLSNFTKFEQFAILAIKEMLSETVIDVNIEKTLLILSTTKGNIDHINTEIDKCNLHNTAQLISKNIGLQTNPLVVSSACISGVSAIVMAADFVRNGECENVIVVGVDIITDFVLKGFNSFKSLSKNICRPYDKQRDGLTIGEASASVLISAEPYEDGIKIGGGAISNDANHISGPSRTGDGLAFAIKRAIGEAEIEAKDIDYINAHGTATLFNDEMESKALNLHRLCGVPINSLKPYIGHTLGAAGVVEVILCCEQIKKGIVYGVLGFDTMGVPYDLNISSMHRNIDINCALKCASGFGGGNAAVVLMGNRDTIVVEGDKAVGIGSAQMDIADKFGYEIVRQQRIEKCLHLNFGDYIKSEYKASGESNLKFYKMDNLSKLGYVAALKLLKDFEFDCEPQEIALVLSNKSSSLDTDIRHQEGVYTLPIDEISPATFVYTLPNIVSGEIAIKHKIQGEVSFFVSNKYDELFLHNYSLNLLRKGMKYVIYGWCELLGEEYLVDLKMIKRCLKELPSRLL